MTLRSRPGAMTDCRPRCSKPLTLFKRLEDAGPERPSSPGSTSRRQAQATSHSDDGFRHHRNRH